MERKSVALAYFLWFVGMFGILGFHRFYLNRPVTGVLWIITMGLFGFGALYDFFSLSDLVRRRNTDLELEYIRHMLILQGRNLLSKVQ